MELKVWVEGVVRVVCGLSLYTSCQDVVIALAQATGQTGRYILILKLRGNERQLAADECPLEHLAQLGQLAPEVQFILRRTGPSLSKGQDTPTRDRHLPSPRSSEPEPRRTKPNRAWSPSPRASPEQRASPVSLLDAPKSVKDVPSYPSKKEVLRQILQQQRRLQDLEIQLQALERETEAWEQERSSAMVPSLTLGLAEELEELEQRLRQNEAELMHRANWEEQLQAEMDREQDMHRHLHQIHSSMDDQGYQIKELQTRSAHLERVIQLTAHRQSSWAVPWQQEEALRPLRQELHNRLQQGEEMVATLSETQRELHAAEERLQKMNASAAAPGGTKAAPPKFKQKESRQFKSKAPKAGQKGLDDVPGMDGLGGTDVICPWEAFGDMELSDLAQFGIV
ncbi:ras association domain-containing protein 8-like isoform X2 [Xiphias gladius]|uniref:ras association domain-containing protein 8-like isoform X2 n=1 Tax=Xiphias gladius TaxID=8245 RepID=UPI001A992728|nr:ras association domain-containing protein 8-like isoform X2 [Xiphias gladius]